MEGKHFFLVYIDPEGRERVYHLKSDLSVGRSSSCEIHLDLEGVSRRHCLFHLRENKVTLEDLESTNGTYLNGSRIREAVVRSGDQVVVGTCTLTLLMEGDAPLTAGRHTLLMGETTIETLLEGGALELPDPAALENAGLQGDYLQALFSITELVNSTTLREKLQEETLPILMTLFGMDLGAYILSYAPDDPPKPVLTVNNSGAAEYHPSSSVLKRVMDTNVSVIATDVVERSDLRKAQSIAVPGTACIMCVPMGTVGGIHGALYLSSLKQGAPLKKGALQLLTAMASQISLALENLSHLERLKRDNLALRSSLESRGDMKGSSLAMDEIRRLIRKVAVTDATVLITGESGTGKELIAQAIHAQSSRSERPMVSINCGAIPETMVESELFGHERGAFTGALERKMGKFELASESTLFLDEIGELSPATQVKLLRALEEKSFYRVGGDRLIRVDVRILAATNANLADKIDKGDFRRDLFYRLQVFMISVPPLRERIEDLPDLVDHFLRIPVGEKGLQVSAEGMKRLQAYPWPGNVRELKNVLEREVILAEGDQIHLESLDPMFRESRAPINPCSSLKEAERAHILRVLKSVDWNKKAAAEILGIGRPTIYDKIKQYGIDEKE